MDLSKSFTKVIEKDKNYWIAYDLVRKNSKGKIWLIGGALTRTLNFLVHGFKAEGCDYDFIVEHDFTEFDLPEGWRVGKNTYGGMRFTKGEISIDYLQLNAIAQNIRRKLPGTIENFLSGNPFTIQAMTYDTETKEIVGPIGLAALEAKKFEVNDIEQATIVAKNRGMSVNELILKKAKSMGFEPVLIKK